MDGKKILKFFNRYWLILVLIVAFLLRLPSLLEPLSYGDEAIYLTLGIGIKKGLLLYRDIYDNKPPLLYLLAAIAGNLFWFRFLLTASCLTAIVFMSKLIKTIFPQSQSAKIIGTIFFALITSLPIIEGNIANSEIFQVLPIVTAVYLLFQEKARSSNWFFAGLLFSAAILLKVPVIFDFAAIVLFIIFFSSAKKRLAFPAQLLALLGGFILPISLVSLYFGLHHQLKLFFQVAFLQNLGYLSSWKTGTHAFSLINLLKTDFFLKGAFIFVVFMVFWWQKSKLKNFPVFILIWFLFSLFGATLPERPYPHYLIQAVPSFSLIFAYFFVKKPKILFLIPIFSAVLIAGVCLRYHVWRYPTISRYQNFLNYISGRKDKNAYFSYFNSQLPYIYGVAEQILASTSKNDRIFVWGDDAFLYVLTGRLPATPYVAAYHITDFKKFEEVIFDLSQKPPSFIIVKRNFSPFPQLDIILRNNYFMINSLGDYIIYLKRGFELNGRQTTGQKH